MVTVFIKLLNMSIAASWLVLAVIALRFLLNKAPKWIMGILWGFVAFRLVFPFSLESTFSLIPSAETIPQNFLTSQTPMLNSGFEVFNQTVNPLIANTFSPDSSDSANPMQLVAFIASAVWLIGILAMFTYTVVSFICIRRKVKEAVQLQKNVWLCDHIAGPFILGIFRPRIYLPSSMNEADLNCVILHEEAHLKRKDHIWKPFGFLLLSVYWYNPLLWLAYILLCKDIEFACDEKVIRQFGAEFRKTYSNALVNCSAPGKILSVCPLAFGEADVVKRVRGVLNYKKPAFWGIIIPVIACILTALCLLTNPRPYHGTAVLDAPLQILLDTQIAEHNKSEHTNDNFIAVDYEILEVDESFSATKVYMWVLYTEYSSRNGELNVESSAHTPTVITATKRASANENGLVSYELDDYRTPRDGSLYESDIKEIFPRHLWKDAFNGQQYITRQNEACLKAAMEYFGIFKSEIGGAEEPDNVIVKPSNYSQVYYYSSEKDHATLSLDPQSRKFTFVYSTLSSHFATGTYEENDAFITAHTDDGNFIYTFKKEGTNIVFAADNSSSMPAFTYSSDATPKTCVPDGAVFEPKDIKKTYSNTDIYESE